MQTSHAAQCDVRGARMALHPRQNLEYMRTEVGEESRARSAVSEIFRWDAGTTNHMLPPPLEILGSVCEETSISISTFRPNGVTPEGDPTIPGSDTKRAMSDPQITKGMAMVTIVKTTAPPMDFFDLVMHAAPRIQSSPASDVLSRHTASDGTQTPKMKIREHAATRSISGKMCFAEPRRMTIETSRFGGAADSSGASSSNPRSSDGGKADLGWLAVLLERHQHQQQTNGHNDFVMFKSYTV